MSQYWDYVIVYGNIQMCAYHDVNCAGNMDDCKCTLGYVFLLGNGVINWNNKKQTSTVIFNNS